MGLRDKYEKKIEERGFRPLELNADNTSVLFDRCLARRLSESGEDSSIVSCHLFPLALGNDSHNFCNLYGVGTEHISSFDFDRKSILANKANIQYLFGQLHCVHTQKEILTINDFFENYSNQVWTSNEVPLLKLLYLCNCDEIWLIHPFNARKGGVSRFMGSITPTLSPKDPNFPEWWEAHKGAWE